MFYESCLRFVPLTLCRIILTCRDQFSFCITFVQSRLKLFICITLIYFAGVTFPEVVKRTCIFIILFFLSFFTFFSCCPLFVLCLPFACLLLALCLVQIIVFYRKYAIFVGTFDCQLSGTLQLFYCCSYLLH